MVVRGIKITVKYGLMSILGSPSCQCSNQTSKTRFLSTFQKTYGRTSDNNDHISSLGQSSRFITIIQTASRITKANHRICRKSASKKSISLRRKAQFKSHFFSSCQCTKMNQNLNLDQKGPFI